ncbi:MAG: hypothetical protein E3J90_09125 [Promethearchaeota archaeon]|nr:MAG: hypothetical protein E3J90_09125 [Candidatus Lokiarchaeota archaeon]
MQSKVLLLDLAHNEMLTLDEEFSEFLKLLKNLNLKIVKNENKDLTKKVLENVDILVLGNPIDDYFSNIEIKDIVNFVRTGGCLFIISEYGADYLQKTNLNDIANHFGFLFEKNLIKEQNPKNLNCSSILHIHDFPEVDFLNGLREVVIGGTCSLYLKKGANALLETDKLNNWSEIYSNSSEEWEKDKEQLHVIAAYAKFGQGKVIAFGDIDIFCSDDNIGINSLDNQKFLHNVFSWLIEPVKKSDVNSFILEQIGELQNGVKNIQTTINNLIETMSILEKRLTHIEENSENLEETPDAKRSRDLESV